MREDKSIIEWHYGDGGFPLGVPLILCVHELDNLRKCYVDGPRTAIKTQNGCFKFLDNKNNLLSGVRIYAWALWPEPLKFELKRL